MTRTGYIDWHRLAKSSHWISTDQGVTYVYAYWMADYPDRNSGLAMLRGSGLHPDWFCAGLRVDQILTACELHPRDVVSPNMTEVYESGIYPRPMLASLCLGTADTTYGDGTYYWWAAPGDLNKQGTRLIKDINALYEREPVILTYLDFAPIGQTVPGASNGQATARRGPGAPPPGTEETV